MSEAASFTPRPRVARRHAPSFDVDNFLSELDIITHRVERVAALPAEGFSTDCPEYGAPCAQLATSRRTRAIRAWTTGSCGWPSPATCPT